ncbi:MAG TPA: ArsC family reductase [Crenotrichaceae bacterium]|nr:ArsC family reductase [Crenotrichaceae bacterium]
MTTLYGIKNCDTVKKARNYLDNHSIDHDFHDYRSDGLTQIQLKSWVVELGWETLINKRSATWRQLPDVLKGNLDEVEAIKVMLEQPTLIKRPLLELDGSYYLGFSIQDYDAIFFGAD